MEHVCRKCKGYLVYRIYGAYGYCLACWDVMSDEERDRVRKEQEKINKRRNENV